MKKEFSDRIGKAMGDRRDAVHARDRLADAEQEFVSGFHVACDQTIKPAMQEVSDDSTKVQSEALWAGLSWMLVKQAWRTFPPI